MSGRMTGSAAPGRALRVGTRNATYQHWETLLRNRTKRHRAGQFVVQGVRPITMALEHGWRIAALLRPDGVTSSDWAARVWAGPTDAQDDGARYDVARYDVAPELFAELADREDGRGELLAVVSMPADDLSRLAPSAYVPLVVFDRPGQPGNIGTLLRSIDAFGGAGLVITGHAADPYDPKSVRASTGSLFAVPVVRAGGAQDVLAYVDRLRTRGPVALLGTDEGGSLGVRDVDFSTPTVLVVGNETRGLSTAWRERCDAIVSIPMAATTGAASSLNAATAGSILLHESLQQRLASP